MQGGPILSHSINEFLDGPTTYHPAICENCSGGGLKRVPNSMLSQLTPCTECEGTGRTLIPLPELFAGWTRGEKG